MLDKNEWPSQATKDYIANVRCPDTVFIPMIESPRGIENLDAICSIPGVHAVFVGPNDLTVNMVDVGEETGELDTMLYKVADTYDEEVAVLTDGLTKLMEPLLIIFLGGAVGFIVIALFVPLVDLINNLSG